MNYYSKIFFFLTACLISNRLFAQMNILGPTCVIASREYQYLIEGDWAADSTMQVCVEGGIIAGLEDSCKRGSFPDVQIIWRDSANHQLQLSSASGNSNLEPELTTELSPGKVDSMYAVQIITTDSIPGDITCSIPTGGSCSPNYIFIWQLSEDCLHWTDSETTTPQFSFTSPLTKTAYYRRKVSETNSNSVDYSNVVTILVHQPIE